MPDLPAHRISSEQNASLRVGDLAGRRRLRFSFRKHRSRFGRLWCDRAFERQAAAGVQADRFKGL